MTLGASPAGTSVEATLDAVWRMEASRLIARLARMLDDVGRAEELAQDAMLSALEHWRRDGVPDNPAAWLMTAARNRGIDALRQRRLRWEQQPMLQDHLEPPPMTAPDDDEAVQDRFGDDMLRLLFVACHPALPRDAQVALTLRLLGGLDTAWIARAFLVPEATVAQRIVRAKRTLAERGIGFAVPPPAEWPQRIDAVLEVIYLIFNEGYAASTGDDWTRPALCEEALRLARVLARLQPHDARVAGLLALMELQASRLRARTDDQGRPVLLDAQDRARWDWLQINRGLAALQVALQAGGGADPYVLQAAIAACHARARRADDTDWPRIAALYTALLQVQPSPVVALNRAVAVWRASGVEAAWALLVPLLDEPRLRDHAPLAVVHGELLEQLRQPVAARDAFARALALTANAGQRAVLQARIDQLNRGQGTILSAAP